MDLKHCYQKRFGLESDPNGHFIGAIKMPKKTKLIPTIPIDVFITLISKLVHICVLLIIVFDTTAVVAGVTKIVLINIPLVHVGHQHAIVL